MDAEQYKALFFLVSGISFFTFMLLGLRFLSGDNGQKSPIDEDLDWAGVIDLVVDEIILETPNIKSFRFKRKDGKEFPKIKAGQFLSFQIGADAKCIRSYSLSSPESSRSIVQVSVKKLDDGVGSTWFHQLQKGDVVKAHSPSGHFVDSGTDKERVYIAGGVGITPILSIVLSNLDKGISSPMILFYGARTEADLAFHGLLEYLAKRHQHFTYYPVLSHDGKWSGEQGFLNIEFLKKKLGSLAGKEYYICGPDPMTEPLLDGLDKASVSEESIFSERFVSPTRLDEASLPERSLKVTFMGKTLDYHGRESVLDFLESQGENLAYACRTGVCGSCKCKISGSYKMLTDAGLTRAEKKEGLALACVSFPESDIEVSLT